MRYWLFLVAIFFFCQNIHAQIGGISGGKINAFNHLPIPKGTAEFEPNYGFYSVSKFWDNDGQLQAKYGSKDSLEINSQISFRMAYTFSDKFELGTFIAESFTNWSFKYVTLDKEKFGLAVIGGLNFPFGSAVIDKSQRKPEHHSQYILGLASSHQFSESTSLDINLQYQDYFGSHPEIPKSDIFIYADVGHYLGDSGIQLLSSLGYQISQLEDTSSTKMTFYPGVAFEMQSNYFIVANAFFDLIGQNAEKTSGISIAWTITL